MMKHFPFGGGVGLALAPVDFNTSPASAYCKVVDVNEYLVFVVMAGAGAAGAHPVFSLTQAQNNAGLGAISLGIEKVLFKKGGAVGGAFRNQDDIFTEETSPNRENPIASYDTAGHTPGPTQSVHLLFVRPIDLNEGYTHLRLNITCPGSKVGCVAVHELGKAYMSRETPGSIDPA